jgi:hypothetical protein
MTHSIAWSDLSIATRDDCDNILLIRQFQLIADDLGDQVYEGIIGLPLSSKYSQKQYQKMNLDRLLQFASAKEATVIINTEEDLEAMTPYMQEIVTAFSDTLSGD